MEILIIVVLSVALVLVSLMCLFLLAFIRALYEVEMMTVEEVEEIVDDTH